MRDVLNKVKPWEIVHGDCLQLMRELPDGCIDAVICDLPYGTTQCAWDSVIPFEPLWEQYRRVVKPNGAIVLTASQPFTSLLVASNLKWFRHERIWQKNCGSNYARASREPFKEHENVLVFSSGQTTYNPIREERAASGADRIKYKYSDRKFSEHIHIAPDTSDRQEKRLPGSVQKFNRETGLHPTQKPVPLMEYLIQTYTDVGDIILDNCAGSGSTPLAALNTGRFCIAIEKEEKYCEVARQRLAQAELSSLWTCAA